MFCFCDFCFKLREFIHRIQREIISAAENRVSPPYGEVDPLLLIDAIGPFDNQ